MQSLKILNRNDRRFPCGHALARFEFIGDTVLRRCPSCKQRYIVRFVPASAHVHDLTGREVWRTEWEAV